MITYQSYHYQPHLASESDEHAEELPPITDDHAVRNTRHLLLELILMGPLPAS